MLLVGNLLGLLGVPDGFVAVVLLSLVCQESQ
jgi:hypothetical protein